MVHRDVDINQKIAAERIEKLFVQAEESFREHPELSQRYVKLARNLSTRYKVRFTSLQKALFCKNCNAYLKVGINSKTRLGRGIRIVTCLNCSAVKRMSYRKKKIVRNVSCTNSTIYRP